MFKKKNFLPDSLASHVSILHYSLANLQTQNIVWVSLEDIDGLPGYPPVVFLFEGVRMPYFFLSSWSVFKNTVYKKSPCLCFFWNRENFFWETKKLRWGNPAFKKLQSVFSWDRFFVCVFITQKTQHLKEAAFFAVIKTTFSKISFCFF